jgi:hypothetical protein
MFTWDCVTAQPGCPDAVPNRGAPCTTPGLECNYGVCETLGWRLGCAGGVWEALQNTTETACVLNPPP